MVSMPGGLSPVRGPTDILGHECGASAENLEFKIESILRAPLHSDGGWDRAPRGRGLGDAGENPAREFVILFEKHIMILRWNCLIPMIFRENQIRHFLAIET